MASAGMLGHEMTAEGIRRALGPVLTVGAVLVGIAVVLLAVSYVAAYPSRQADQLATRVAARPPISDPKDQAAFEQTQLQYKTDNQIKIWTGAFQAIGALVLAVGGYSTWQNLVVAQRNLQETRRKIDADRDATERRLAVDREGQVTNRFTQAITQLGAELKDGKPNLAVRLGGIYALEQLAKDDPKRYHWTVMEVLTAYVRENAPWPPQPLLRPGADQASADAPADQAAADAPEPPEPKPRTDVQAILTVLGRRQPPHHFSEPGPLDLTRTDLRGAVLRDAHLKGADFTDAHLEKAFCYNAHLERAAFYSAHLEEGNFYSAHLEEGIFLRAQLDGADFLGAQLDGADFLLADGLTPEQLLNAHDYGPGPRLPQNWTEKDRVRVRRKWEVGARTAPAQEETAPAAAQEVLPEVPPAAIPSQAPPLNGMPPSVPQPTGQPLAPDQTVPPAASR